MPLTIGLGTWFLLQDRTKPFERAGAPRVVEPDRAAPEVAAETRAEADAMPALEPVVVRIHAIIVSDDDGSRTARITNDQIMRSVKFANRVFRRAGVTFDYDPKSGYTDTFDSTLINSIMGIKDANWRQSKRYGNEIAALYPDRLVLFFRFGPGEKGTGKGFSWIDYNFVAMPGYADDTHCGHEHLDALAHEIGHYFGLAHTFAHDPFQGVEEAEAYLTSKDGAPGAFDGDGFADTPPDPVILSAECDRTESVTLNGTEFVLPRRNIMSYYDERDTLSPQQIERVRWILDKRRERRMAMPTNLDGLPVIEIEALEIARSDNCTTSVQHVARFAVGSWSGDAHLFCRAGPDSMLMLRLPTDVTGPHKLRLYATRAPDYAIVQIYVDGRPAGPPVDLYAPAVIPSGAIDVGEIDIHEGTHRIAITVTGKNPASTNYYFGLDAVALIRDE